MSEHALAESPLDPAAAVFDAIVRAGEPWMKELRQGQTLRIVDLEGNQAVDTLFYNARDPDERYSATDTIRAQGKHLSHHRHAAAVQRGPRAADHRRRHLRPPRHAGRRLLGREQPGALRPRQAQHAQLPRQLPAARWRQARHRHEQARPRQQHQLLHERAGHPAGRADLRRRHLRRRALRGDARRDGRAGADLQLPAAQQPLQRLQSDARSGCWIWIDPRTTRRAFKPGRPGR